MLPEDQPVDGRWWSVLIHVWRWFPIDKPFIYNPLPISGSDTWKIFSNFSWKFWGELWSCCRKEDEKSKSPTIGLVPVLNGWKNHPRQTSEASEVVGNQQKNPQLSSGLPGKSSHTFPGRNVQHFLTHFIRLRWGPPSRRLNNSLLLCGFQLTKHRCVRFTLQQLKNSYCCTGCLTKKQWNDCV